jgi:hypothetical protein
LLKLAEEEGVKLLVQKKERTWGGSRCWVVLMRGGLESGTCWSMRREVTGKGRGGCIENDAEQLPATISHSMKVHHASYAME